MAGQVQFIGKKIQVHGVPIYVGMSSEDEKLVKFQIQDGPPMTFTTTQARLIGQEFIKYADIVDCPPFEETGHLKIIKALSLHFGIWVILGVLGFPVLVYFLTGIDMLGIF